MVRKIVPIFNFVHNPPPGSECIEVRCYDPPRLDFPLGRFNRDHRKMLSVDDRIGFITGPCIGRMQIAS